MIVITIRAFSIVFVMMGAAAITGCATPGASSYSLVPAQSRNVVNEEIVEKPQPDVWDVLVRNIAKSFFVINNIDKSSRIINVSFSSDAPREYVDCGKTIRSYADSHGTQTWEYAITDSVANYTVASPNENNPRFSTTAYVSRRSTHEGRANIYIAPSGQNATLITVNVNHVVKIETTGRYVVLNLLGAPIRSGVLPLEVATLRAVTKQPTNNNYIVQTAGISSVTCYSTGALESAILKMAY